MDPMLASAVGVGLLAVVVLLVKNGGPSDSDKELAKRIDEMRKRNKHH